MHRRRFLATAGACAVGGLAGCASVPTGTETDPLGVIVANHSGERRTVRVRVEGDGEVLANPTVDLDPNVAEPLPCSWADRTGDVRIAGLLEGDDEWTELDLADYDSECAFVYLNVNPAVERLDFAISDDCDRESAC